MYHTVVCQCLSFAQFIETSYLPCIILWSAKFCQLLRLQKQVIFHVSYCGLPSSVSCPVYRNKLSSMYHTVVCQVLSVAPFIETSYLPCIILWSAKFCQLLRLQKQVIFHVSYCGLPSSVSCSVYRNKLSSMYHTVVCQVLSVAPFIETSYLPCIILWSAKFCQLLRLQKQVIFHVSYCGLPSSVSCSVYRNKLSSMYHTVVCPVLSVAPFIETSYLPCIILWSAKFCQLLRLQKQVIFHVSYCGLPSSVSCSVYRNKLSSMYHTVVCQVLSVAPFIETSYLPCIILWSAQFCQLLRLQKQVIFHVSYCGLPSSVSCSVYRNKLSSMYHTVVCQVLSVAPFIETSYLPCIILWSAKFCQLLRLQKQVIFHVSYCGLPSSVSCSVYRNKLSSMYHTVVCQVVSVAPFIETSYLPCIILWSAKFCQLLRLQKQVIFHVLYCGLPSSVSCPVYRNKLSSMYFTVVCQVLSVAPFIETSYLPCIILWSAKFCQLLRLQKQVIFHVSYCGLPSSVSCSVYRNKLSSMYHTVVCQVLSVAPFIETSYLPCIILWSAKFCQLLRLQKQVIFHVSYCGLPSSVSCSVYRNKLSSMYHTVVCQVLSVAPFIETSYLPCIIMWSAKFCQLLRLQKQVIFHVSYCGLPSSVSCSVYRNKLSSMYHTVVCQCLSVAPFIETSYLPCIILWSAKFCQLLRLQKQVICHVSYCGLPSSVSCPVYRNKLSSMYHTVVCQVLSVAQFIETSYLPCIILWSAKFCQLPRLQKQIIFHVSYCGLTSSVSCPLYRNKLSSMYHTVVCQVLSVAPFIETSYLPCIILWSAQFCQLLRLQKQVIFHVSYCGLPSSVSCSVYRNKLSSMYHTVVCQVLSVAPFIETSYLPCIILWSAKFCQLLRLQKQVIFHVSYCGLPSSVSCSVYRNKLSSMYHTVVCQVLSVAPFIETSYLPCIILWSAQFCQLLRLQKQVIFHVSYCGLPSSVSCPVYRNKLSSMYHTVVCQVLSVAPFIETSYLPCIILWSAQFCQLLSLQKQVIFHVSYCGLPSSVSCSVYRNKLSSMYHNVVCQVLSVAPFIETSYLPCIILWSAKFCQLPSLQKQVIFHVSYCGLPSSVSCSVYRNKLSSMYHTVVCQVLSVAPFIETSYLPCIILWSAKFCQLLRLQKQVIFHVSYCGLPVSVSCSVYRNKLSSMYHTVVCPVLSVAPFIETSYLPCIILWSAQFCQLLRLQKQVIFHVSYCGLPSSVSCPVYKNKLSSMYHTVVCPVLSVAPFIETSYLPCIILWSAQFCQLLRL